MKDVIKYKEGSIDVYFNDKIGIAFATWLDKNRNYSCECCIVNPAEMSWLLKHKYAQFETVKKVPEDVAYYFRIAASEWARMRLLARKSKIKFLDLSYIDMVKKSNEIFLVTKKMSRVLFQVSLYHPGRFMSRSEFVFNLLREDFEQFNGGLYYISYPANADTAYVALYNDIKDEIEFFLKNPSDYDYNADKCNIGIFKQEYQAIFTIENGKKLEFVAKNEKGIIRFSENLPYKDWWLKRLEEKKVNSVMADERALPEFQPAFPYACLWKFWKDGNEIDFGFNGND